MSPSPVLVSEYTVEDEGRSRGRGTHAWAFLPEHDRRRAAGSREVLSRMSLVVSVIILPSAWAEELSRAIIVRTYWMRFD